MGCNAFHMRVTSAPSKDVMEEHRHHPLDCAAKGVVEEDKFVFCKHKLQGMKVPLLSA